MLYTGLAGWLVAQQSWAVEDQHADFLLYQHEKVIWLLESATALLQNSPFIHSHVSVALKELTFPPSCVSQRETFLLLILCSFDCGRTAAIQTWGTHVQDSKQDVHEDQWSLDWGYSPHHLDFVMTTACLAASINYFSWSRSDSFSHHIFNL